MSKKKTRRSKRKEIIKFQEDNLFCGFPLIEKNIKQMFRWDTLENC